MTKATGIGRVECDLDQQGVLTIQFDHPASNSLPGSLLSALADSIDQAGKEAGCRVILLKSGGSRAFCAGASFDELIDIQDEKQGLAFFSGFSKVILAIRRSSKFVVCRVQGKAVGGGVGIAAAADITYGTHHAAVKLSELAIGIGPFVVGPAVERKIGKAAFTAMAIDATSWYSAEWAKSQGLYAEVFQTTDELDQAINDLTRQLASSSPEAMEELKNVFWEGTDHWEKLLPERAAISGKLVLSEFTRSAISRFKSKA